MTKQHIIMIGDEWSLLHKIAEALQTDGVDVHRANSCQTAFDLVSRFACPLIIVDLAFSKTCSFEFISKLRSLHSEMILVLSACASEQEEILSLKAGADRYLEIGLPMDVERCIANVQAILRRMQMRGANHTALFSIEEYGLKINLSLRKAYVHGGDLHLTPTEFTLLKYLAEHFGEAVTKEQLTQQVWKDQYDISSDAALKYHIKELRKKLKQHGVDGLIETAWGIGYFITLTVV